MGPHETKYLCTAKDATTEMKKQPIKWGENLHQLSTDNEIVSVLHNAF